MKTINIMGIHTYAGSRKEFFETVRSRIHGDKQTFIVTANPEIILESIKSEEYNFILNSSGLTVADGFGLKLAALFCGANIPRIAGADLARYLLDYAKEKSLKVMVVLWQNGLTKAKDLKSVLDKDWNGLKYEIREVGREENFDGGEHGFRPEIIMVGLGAPWQEVFIKRNLEKMPYARLAVGLGGSFDFISGKAVRAPKAFRAIGLEWAWRLFFNLDNPARLRRIFRAVAVFPFFFFKWRFFNPFFYRKSVVCLAYKNQGMAEKILIVKRRDQAHHWQLPQGGMEGEDAIQAGLRELREELNTDKFRPVSSFRNVWKYKFGRKDYISFRRSGYKGQKQSLFIAEFTGRNEDLKINLWDHSDWKWVDADKLPEEVHQVRRASAEIFLKKFKENKWTKN